MSDKNLTLLKAISKIPKEIKTKIFQTLKEIPICKINVSKVHKDIGEDSIELHLLDTLLTYILEFNNALKYVHFPVQEKNYLKTFIDHIWDDSEGKEDLILFLQELISLDSITSISRGIHRELDSDNLVYNFMLQSDIVFIEPKLDNAIILHSIKIDYDEKQKRRNISFTLTPELLNELQKLLDCALEKGAELIDKAIERKINIINNY